MSPSVAIRIGLLSLPMATYASGRTPRKECSSPKAARATRSAGSSPRSGSPSHYGGSGGHTQIGLGAIRFVIHDEGPGFEVSTTDAGEGIQIMHDRLAALAGELTIESQPGRGTTVTGRVPNRIMAGTPA